MSKISTAFLSSLFWEHEALRAKLHQEARNRGIQLWVAEIDAPALSSKPPLEIVDTILREVRKADHYVCILGPHRHGSLVPIKGKETNVSYLELEVFHAALLQKPITLFLTKSFDPDKRLASLIEILRFALPSAAFSEQLSESQIISRTMEALNEQRHRKKNAVRAWLTHIFDLRRSASIGATLDSGIQFLGGAIDTTGDLPDKDLVKHLLDEEETVEHREQKLGRIWLAARELLGAPYAEARYAEYRDLWNTVLGRWSRAGSWYGLHAHLYLGVLAARKSQAHVRELMRESRRSTHPTLVHPGGGLASAYYSIAGRQPTRHRKHLNYRKALWQLEQSIAEGHGNPSTLLAIRGSVYLRLGQPWRACADYENVVRLREQAGAQPHQLGEALSELGYGYLLAGKLLTGRRYLEQGVQLMSGGQGFLVRAKKKLAIAYALTGHPLRAKQEMLEARKIAEELGLFDQL